MKTIRFRHWDCLVEKTTYRNGRPALILNDVHSGEQIAVATVNLPNVPAGRNDVFIKDYSENEGMLAALQSAGVVRVTGDMVHCGCAQVPRCELLPPFREKTFGEQLKEQAASWTTEPAARHNGREI